jgi:predicted nucleic acid-binding protein
MIVVADTSPINYLITIGEIDVLASLYGTVIIPPAVRDELSRDRAPEAVRRWISRSPAWLSVRTPALPPDAGLLAADLDAGEFEAILVAQELGVADLIIDDWMGRKEAERRASITLARSESLSLRRRKASLTSATQSRGYAERASIFGRM